MEIVLSIFKLNIRRVRLPPHLFICMKKSSIVYWISRCVSKRTLQKHTI